MRIEPSNGIVLSVTASATVSDRPCIVQAVNLNPAAAACTVSLYDPVFGSTSTTNATLRATISAPASVASPALAISASGIEFSYGCIAVVTGTGATSTIVFAKI